MEPHTQEGAGPSPAAAPQAPETQKPQKERSGRVFDLVADGRGAMVNGALFTLYAAVSLVFSVRAEPNSVWFYVFYFLTFLAVFQGGTIVLRQCLHLFPKSTVRVEVLGKALRITRRNGGEIELIRDIDYTRRKNTLVLQGKTHDNQAYSEVIRQGTLPDGDLDTLVNALKRFR